MAPSSIPRPLQVSRLLHRSTGHTHTPFEAPMVKRARANDALVSIESVDFQVPHSAKSKQAWRYPGNSIMRAPSVLIYGTRYYDPKSKGGGEQLPRRKNESNFFITINSNKSTEGNAEHAQLADAAMAQMLELLSKETNIAQYLKFGPKDASYEKDKYIDVVQSVDWQANVERGDVQQRVHAHVWLTIVHYSQIQINVQMLQHMARKAYNAHINEAHSKAGYLKYNELLITAMPYVHVKLLPQSDWTSVMRQYIHKGMAAASS